MGLFGGTESNSFKNFEPYLSSDEMIEGVYKLIIDEICFTNKRIIFYDKFMFSTRKEKVCIPYHSISYFSLEDDGLLDRHIEVKLFIRGESAIDLQFAKGCDMIAIEKLLTRHICF